MKPQLGDIWYRYYDTAYWPHSNIHVAIRLAEYTVIGLTPAGVWLSEYSRNYWSRDHQFAPGKVASDVWVSIAGRKRKAYSTRELAWESFCARKRCELMHVQNRLARCEAVKALYEKVTEPPRVDLVPPQPKTWFEELR